MLLMLGLCLFVCIQYIILFRPFQHETIGVGFGGEVETGG